MQLNELLGFVAFFTMITLVFRPIAIAIGRRLEARSRGAALPADTAARLERMEQAIDAMAVEIERMSEGQRFVAKLLAERGHVSTVPAATDAER